MRRRLFGDGQPDIASSLAALAILRDAEGKYTEALELSENARGIYTTALSADHWRTAIAESAEGAALTGLGRFPEADKCLNHSYGILSNNSGAPLMYRKLAQRYLDALHKRERHPGGTSSLPATALAARPTAGRWPRHAACRR